MSEPIESKKSGKAYQFPFLGGVLAGCGFGLWAFYLLSRLGFRAAFGDIGVIGLGFVLVMIGVLVGLPTRGSRST